MARRGRRQVLQLDDVSSSHSSSGHSPRPHMFTAAHSEEVTRKAATKSLISLVSYASDASSDDDSDDDDSKAEEVTPPSSSTKEDNPGSVEVEPVLEIPLPAEVEPLRGPEPPEGAELQKRAESGKEAEPPSLESMLDIPLPESSGPPPPQRSQRGNVGMESELANFFAEIESISTDNAPPDPEEIPLPTSLIPPTTADPSTTVESSPPREVDHGFIPRPDASVSKVTEEERPESPVEVKTKAAPVKNAYQSMFVKGASEFVKPEKLDEKKENGVDEEEEELPEEPVSDWRIVQDDSTGYYYYWNMVTNEVTWEIPPGYTQFLLLYKEYEERIAAIPKDKLLRLKKEKKKHADSSGRESSPAPSASTSTSSSKSKKEKKQKKEKHRKEKPESTSSTPAVQIGPQLPPPMPAQDNGTEDRAVADQSDAKTAEDARRSVSPKPSSEEKREEKAGEAMDSAVDSTSLSLPQDVEAIFDEALSTIKESHVDSSKAEAVVDMFRDDEQQVAEKSVTAVVISSSVTETSSVPPSLDVTTSAASVDSSKSVSAGSSKAGSPAPADSAALPTATVSASTSAVSSSSVVSSVSLPVKDSWVDSGGEGVVTNSGVKDTVAVEEEEEDDLDMDFDDIDDVDRALEKALEKKKAELEKLESRCEEDMVSSDSLPQSSSAPTHSSPSETTELTTCPQAGEEESTVSSSVKSMAAQSPAPRHTSRSVTEDKDAADSSEARSEPSRRKRSAAESSTKSVHEGSKRNEPVAKRTRLVNYDTVETDEESMEAAEEGSTSPAPAPSGKPSGEGTTTSVNEAVPTPSLPEAANISGEIADMADTACAKLAFLDVTVEGLSRLQTSLIALQTRLTDWKKGGLSSGYFYQCLKEVNELLTQYESSAVPPGWTCQWDSNFRRYFYIHEITQQTQWEYPEASTDPLPKTGEHPRRSRKGKSSKKKKAKVIGPEPMSSQNQRTAEESEAAVADPEGSTGHLDGVALSGDGVVTCQDGAEEDLDGVAMSKEEGEEENQELWPVNGAKDKPAPAAATEAPALSEGVSSALQALFPGEPLPPGTELLLGLPPPPPPPLPTDDAASTTATTATTTTTTTTTATAEDAYVCADDSSDEDSEKSAERGKEEVVVGDMPNLDPDIDGEEMVEEEEEEEEEGAGMMDRGREEEGVPPLVVEDPAVISRPPQLRFPPPPTASSAGANVSSSVLTGLETSSSLPVLSAAPVLKNAGGGLTLPDSATSATTSSPKAEDGHRSSRSPAPPQDSGSCSNNNSNNNNNGGADPLKKDKPEKHKKKKKEKLGSHTMSLKKKGVSTMVQNWQKVQKEVEKEERATQQRQAAIRQKLEEMKKGSS